MDNNLSYNMFTERVEYFNEKALEKNMEEIEWESYSVKEIQEVLSVTEDEATKLLNSGLFKVYRVGHEYRATKKSVEENKKIITAMTTYQSKKTMTVRDLSRLLGLGKTATYRLVGKNYFKKYLVFGTIRIDVESFDNWYSGQFHYKKVTGERPGGKYEGTIAPITMAKVLGIPKSTAYDFMKNGLVDFVRINGARRVLRESFEKWYASQNHYKMIKSIEEVEDYVD